MNNPDTPPRGLRGWTIRRRIVLLLIPGLLCIAVALGAALFLAGRLTG